MGGIATLRTRWSSSSPGASAGSGRHANFVDPLLWQPLVQGLEAYMKRHDISRVSDLVGTLSIPQKAGK
jgi:dihydroorotate dehydrogenase